MLSHEDNETLVRVGLGTAMGDFFRLFWIPFLRVVHIVHSVTVSRDYWALAGSNTLGSGKGGKTRPCAVAMDKQ
jgi:hypothetical protein